MRESQSNISSYPHFWQCCRRQGLGSGLWLGFRLSKGKLKWMGKQTLRQHRQRKEGPLMPTFENVPCVTVWFKEGTQMQT